MRFSIQYRLGFFDGADVVFPRGHFEGGFEAVGGLLQQAQFVARGDKFPAPGVSFADGVYGFGNFARCIFHLQGKADAERGFGVFVGVEGVSLKHFQQGEVEVVRGARGVEHVYRRGACLEVFDKVKIGGRIFRRPLYPLTVRC